ncbi:MAG: hypothetical protein V1809_02420 [Planctomycetota bacterium]
MERVASIDFAKSKDMFIHGLVDDPNGGTCASMPVLYVAVGRRLGYPLKLVQTKAHLFVRWDDGREKFNIEGAGNGFSSYPDDHYKVWPMKSTETEVKTNRYLISMSPIEEFASSIATRGHCLLYNNRFKEAFAAYAEAHRLVPDDPAYIAWMGEAKAKWSPPVPLHRAQGQMKKSADDVEAINAANRKRMEEWKKNLPVPPHPPKHP